MKSLITPVAPVLFPEFTGERFHMREFTTGQYLPRDIRRWQATVDIMTLGIPPGVRAFLMVDQAVVPQGQPHRRGGLHIDGHWHADVKAHGGQQPHHGPQYPQPQPPPPHHGAMRNGRHGGHGSSNGAWHTDNFGDELLLLAADVVGCKAYVGEFSTLPSEGGDYSHMPESELQQLEPVLLEAGVAYRGNITVLHESIPLQQPGPRSMVRINVPGIPWFV